MLLPVLHILTTLVRRYAWDEPNAPHELNIRAAASASVFVICCGCRLGHKVFTGVPFFFQA